VDFEAGQLKKELKASAFLLVYNCRIDKAVTLDPVSVLQVEIAGAAGRGVPVELIAHRIKRVRDESSRPC
jgi:hypothetical protein